MDFNKTIRLPLRILIFAAALAAAFFAVRIDQDIATVLGWEAAGQLFMGILCGALFAFFLVIFSFRGIGFRAVFVLFIAYVGVIFASVFFDGVKGIEHYITAGEFTSGELNTEAVMGFDEARLLELCAMMRKIAAALLAFTVISLAALFVPKPKTAEEGANDYAILPTTGKGLWLSSIYACICTACYIFGGTIWLTRESAPLLFKALFIFQQAIGFESISLRGIGQIMFAIPFIVNCIRKGALSSLLGSLSFSPSYEVITVHSDGSRTSDGGTQSAMGGAFVAIFFNALKYGFLIVLFVVFGIPLTLIKMLASIFKYDRRYDRMDTKPAFFKTPYLIFLLFVITFLAGMTFERAPQLFNMERLTVTQTENQTSIEISQIAGTWTDAENRDWTFSAEGSLIYDDGPMGIKEYEFSISGSKLTIHIDRGIQVYDMDLSADEKTLVLSGGRNIRNWNTAGPGWNKNELIRK